MKEKYDVIVVGAGIVGLSQAILAARTGKSVLVCERDPRPVGASIRNFGMIWPIGQPTGLQRDIAVASRKLWLEVIEEAGLWHRAKGSLHLCYAADEESVLTEFVEQGPNMGYDVTFLTPEEVQRLSPRVKQEGLRGGMFSPLELCIDPRETIAKLPEHMVSKYGIDFQFGTAINSVQPGVAFSSCGSFEAEKIYICTGSDFETLYPEQFSHHNVVRCKLQMMRAKPKTEDFMIGPHLCAGLTLAHYENFKICKGLSKLVERFKNELEPYMKWHIHLLVSQHENGDLTIGDSHEYGPTVSPFAKEEINKLILSYLDTFLPVSDLEVTESWIGVYGKCMTGPFFVEEVEAGVTVVGGVGGAGMTLSFGLAEYVQTGLLSKANCSINSR